MDAWNGRIACTLRRHASSAIAVTHEPCSSCRGLSSLRSPSIQERLCDFMFASSLWALSEKGELYASAALQNAFSKCLPSKQELAGAILP